jgi:hypothetical protein
MNLLDQTELDRHRAEEAKHALFKTAIAESKARGTDIRKVAEPWRPTQAGDGGSALTKSKSAGTLHDPAANERAKFLNRLWAPSDEKQRTLGDLRKAIAREEDLAKMAAQLKSRIDTLAKSANKLAAENADLEKRIALIEAARDVHDSTIPALH